MEFLADLKIYSSVDFCVWKKETYFGMVVESEFNELVEWWYTSLIL